MEAIKRFFARFRNEKDDARPNNKKPASPTGGGESKSPTHSRNKLTVAKRRCRRRDALTIKRQTVTALVVPSIIIITVGGLVTPLHFLVGVAIFCFGLILLLPLPLVIWKMKTFLVEEGCECCCCVSAVASVSNTIDRKAMMGSMSCINGMVDVGPSYVNYAYDTHLDFGAPATASAVIMPQPPQPQPPQPQPPLPPGVLAAGSPSSASSSSSTTSSGSSRPITPALSSSFYTINSSLSGSLPVLNTVVVRESPLI